MQVIPEGDMYYVSELHSLQIHGYLAVEVT